jgi:hypothetical protein
LRSRSQWASGASSVASSSATITGMTTTIMRLANSASSTIPPMTMTARSVTAEATASPRGTASSPAMCTTGRCAAGSARPFACGSAAAGGTSSCAMASG